MCCFAQSKEKENWSQREKARENGEPRELEAVGFLPAKTGKPAEEFPPNDPWPWRSHHKAALGTKRQARLLTFRLKQ